MATAAAPELHDYLGLLRRRLPSIVLVTAVVFGAAIAYSHQRPSKYSSTAQVLVRPVNLSPTTPGDRSTVNMEDERRVAISAEVANIAASTLQAQGISAGRISVSNASGTSILTFRSTSSSPRVAQATAQADADAYLTFRRDVVLDDLRAASQPLDERIAQLDTELDQLQDQILGANDADRSTLQIRFNSLFTQRA